MRRREGRNVWISKEGRPTEQEIRGGKWEEELHCAEM